MLQTTVRVAVWQAVWQALATRVTSYTVGLHATCKEMTCAG